MINFLRRPVGVYGGFVFAEQGDIGFVRVLSFPGLGEFLLVLDLGQGLVHFLHRRIIGLDKAGNKNE